MAPIHNNHHLYEIPDQVFIIPDEEPPTLPTQPNPPEFFNIKLYNVEGHHTADLEFGVISVRIYSVDHSPETSVLLPCGNTHFESAGDDVTHIQAHHDEVCDGQQHFHRCRTTKDGFFSTWSWRCSQSCPLFERFQKAMECEVRALRKELEETRTALKLQTVRCRHLVAAYTTKLKEKEAEVRAGRELRDQQLSKVLRALLALEARLRREQRHIRQQLCDKDQVISAQQSEIERLKTEKSQSASKHDVAVGISDISISEKEEEEEIQQEKPPEETPKDKPSPQEVERPSQPPVRRSLPLREFKPSQSTAFVRFRKNGRHFGSYRPISRRRDLLNGVHQDLDDSENHEDELGARDLSKDYQHNPVLECVNQILLRDQEEADTTYKVTKRFNYECHSIKEEQEQENSSEEEQDEQKFNTQDDKTNPTGESHLSSSSSDISKPEKDNNETIKWSVKDKVPSPPMKAELLEEKTCLLMASQRLSIVSNLEFEELDKKETPEKVGPPKIPVKNGFPSNRSLVPPALPPKPPQLGAKGLYVKKVTDNLSHQPPSTLTNHHHLTNENNSNHSQVTCSKYRSEQNVNRNLKISLEQKSADENEKSTLNRNHSSPNLLEKPRQRQILSNGSLKIALNHDSSPSLTNGHDHHKETNNLRIRSSSFEDRLDKLNLSELQTNSIKQVRVGSSMKNDNQANGRHNHSHEQKRTKPLLHNHTASLKGSMEELSSSKTTNNTNNHCSKIRVGSSVSSLITGSSGNSIVNELTKGESENVIVLPKVSQMVRRFEDLGTGKECTQNEDDDEEDEGNNALRRNFEEFKLEDVDMDSVGISEEGGRPAGDGAEERAAVVQNGTATNGNNNEGGTYEHFLEATGLSQKSILTPSRMYSNHRHVLKPKDVKHRSRVLRAAAVTERSSTSGNGPVVKYWIEPFL